MAAGLHGYGGPQRLECAPGPRALQGLEEREVFFAATRLGFVIYFSACVSKKIHQLKEVDEDFSPTLDCLEYCAVTHFHILIDFEQLQL